MSMVKRIKSNVDYGITILGTYIPPSGIVDIERQFHRHFAANYQDYDDYIASGIITINNDIRDMPISGNLALDYMKTVAEGEDIYYRDEVDKDNFFNAHNLQDAVEEIDFRVLTGEPTGFPNRDDSHISFDDGSREFTIQPSGIASFDYYIKGKKTTITDEDSVVIDDEEGMHFIYYNASGTLIAQRTWDDYLI